MIVVHDLVQSPLPLSHSSVGSVTTRGTVAESGTGRQEKACRASLSDEHFTIFHLADSLADLFDSYSQDSNPTSLTLENQSSSQVLFTAPLYVSPDASSIYSSGFPSIDPRHRIGSRYVAPFTDALAMGCRPPPAFTAVLTRVAAVHRLHPWHRANAPSRYQAQHRTAQGVSINKIHLYTRG